MFGRKKKRKNDDTAEHTADVEPSDQPTSGARWLDDLRDALSDGDDFDDARGAVTQGGAEVITSGVDEVRGDLAPDGDELAASRARPVATPAPGAGGFADLFREAFDAADENRPEAPTAVPVDTELPADAPGRGWADDMDAADDEIAEQLSRAAESATIDDAWVDASPAIAVPGAPTAPSDVLVSDFEGLDLDGDTVELADIDDLPAPPDPPSASAAPEVSDLSVPVDDSPADDGVEFANIDDLPAPPAPPVSVDGVDAVDDDEVDGDSPVASDVVDLADIPAPPPAPTTEREVETESAPIPMGPAPEQDTSVATPVFSDIDDASAELDALIEELSVTGAADAPGTSLPDGSDIDEDPVPSGPDAMLGSAADQLETPAPPAPAAVTDGLESEPVPEVEPRPEAEIRSEPESVLALETEDTAPDHTDDASSDATVPADGVDSSDSREPSGSRSDLGDVNGVRNLLVSGERLGFDPDLVVFDQTG